MEYYTGLTIIQAMQKGTAWGPASQTPLNLPNGTFTIDVATALTSAFIAEKVMLSFSADDLTTFFNAQVLPYLAPGVNPASVLASFLTACGF
jgi:hypothetical protein